MSIITDTWQKDDDDDSVSDTSSVSDYENDLEDEVQEEENESDFEIVKQQRIFWIIQLISFNTYCNTLILPLNHALF